MSILPSWNTSSGGAALVRYTWKEGVLQEFHAKWKCPVKLRKSPQTHLFHQSRNFPGNWHYVSLIRLGAPGDTEQVPPIRLRDPLEAKTRPYPSHRRFPELGIIAPVRLKNLFKSRILSSCLSLGSLPGPWIQIASLLPSLLDLKVYPKPMPGPERDGDGAKGVNDTMSSGAPMGFSTLQWH